jgi:hypothetical protein
MRKLLPRLALALATTVLMFGAAGCKKPKAGGSCTGDRVANSFSGACNGKKAAVVCIDGTYQDVKCGDGPVGCMETMGNVSCDLVADEDEPCFADKKFGCSSDHKKMLECKKGKWSLKMACKSAKGCIDNVKGVSCESAEAEEGDKCEADQKDQGSCNPDKDKLLVCNGKKFVVASTCRGQNHCRAQGSKLACDTSMAEIGDPCEEEDKLSCDTKKKVMLRCNGKTFEKKEECKKRCNNAFDKYSCD